MKNNPTIGWCSSLSLLALTRYMEEKNYIVPEDYRGALGVVSDYLVRATRSFQMLEGKSPGEAFVLMGGDVPLEDAESCLDIYNAMGKNVFVSGETTNHADILKALEKGENPPLEGADTAREFVFNLLEYHNRKEDEAGHWI